MGSGHRPPVSAGQPTAEDLLWLRRVVVGTVVAVAGPPVLGLAFAVGLGRGWQLEGWWALFVGVAWLAGFGFLGAALARVRPIAVGALAGEAFAIGSFFDSPTVDQAIAAVLLPVGAGMVGGALAARLVRLRPPSASGDRLVAAIAVVAGVAFVAAFVGDGPEERPPRVEVVTLVEPGPAPARHCPVSDHAGDRPETDVDLRPDRVEPSGRIEVRYRVEFSEAQFTEIGGRRAHQGINLVVLPEDSAELLYREELTSGVLRRQTSGVASVQLLHPDCGPDGPPPLGRYRAHLEVLVTGDVWLTSPVDLTVEEG